MEAVATREGHGKSCGPRGGPIGGVYGTAKSRIFYRTPARYTAKEKTRRKRIIIAHCIKNRTESDLTMMVA